MTVPRSSSTGLPLEQLAHQLRWHWENHLRPRLSGMTDREYHWEPVAGAWGLRPVGTPAPGYPGAVQAGGGDWVVDFAFPEPSPAPVTTIAWRVSHVLVGVFGVRMAGHFGGPGMDYFSYHYPGTAAEALARLETAVIDWCAAVDGLDEAALAASAGASEAPFEDHPMLELVLHINREAIHHGAEMCLLRDLYAARR
ncbi:DinB family protein [Citricoccus zhacaiensis]|uniref:DinB family protein n=2 Tax=Citricoccus TaxID=169133 RepID=UPI003CF93825